MKRRVVVVSHADADGHVIAEQVRHNLEFVSSFSVTTVIDPVLTKDHKAWFRLGEIREIDSSDLVFFVDLMFAPSSFAEEATALVEFVRARPEKRFFLLDHHPVPHRILDTAPNLRALYRRDVLDCAIGTASRMMILAALCEKQDSRAKTMRTPRLNDLERGLRRAAAPGGPLPGSKLSALLRFDQWEGLVRLGQEGKDEHFLPRGRRQAGKPFSDALSRLDATATALLQRSAPKGRHLAEDVMAYDFDETTNDLRSPVSNSTPSTPHRADDLEAIVTLLELAAIFLSPKPESTFTYDELLTQARELGGGIVLNEKDCAVVLEKAKFLAKETGKPKTYRLRQH